MESNPAPQLQSAPLSEALGASTLVLLDRYTYNSNYPSALLFCLLLALILCCFRLPLRTEHNITVEQARRT